MRTVGLDRARPPVSPSRSRRSRRTACTAVERLGGPGTGAHDGVQASCQLAHHRVVTYRFGPLSSVVEHQFRKLVAPGSNPGAGSKRFQATTVGPIGLRRVATSAPMAKKAKPELHGSFHQIGNPSDGGGYLVQDRDGIIRVFVALMKTQFTATHGRAPRLDEEIVLWSLAREQQERTEAEVRRQGVPPRFARMLATTSKTEQLRALGEQPVSAEEFHALCFNCGTVGYSHESKTFEFMPEHLEIKPEEANALTASGDEELRRQFFKRVPSSFQERKHVTVHLFRPVEGDQWHVIYFTLRDMFGDPTTKTHHWKKGSHVHYLSRALIQLEADQVLLQFESGDWSFPSKHIRYDDDGER